MRSLANSSPTGSRGHRDVAAEGGPRGRDRGGDARRARGWHVRDRDGVARRDRRARAHRAKPEPGKVTSRREIAEIGVTVLTLSNGVEVWLKPTDFRNDQVVFSSYARGGLSLVPGGRLSERIAGDVARGDRRCRRVHADRSRQAAGRPARRRIGVRVQLLAGRQRVEHAEGPGDRAAAGLSPFHGSQRQSARRSS